MIKKTPIICIVGKSESGKTTLIEKLIPELKKRGYNIGSIKHSCQKFDIDKKGKDSWRHRKAGADIVVIASADNLIKKIYLKLRSFVKRAEKSLFV